MKTTLDLPDELMRSIKVKAAREDRKLKDVVADLLRRGMERDAAPRKGHRVKLPLIRGGHPAAPGEEMTPERVADILLQQEVDWALGRE
ncbi:MAG: antitoxin [Dehalococcoidia bacterium]